MFECQANSRDAREYFASGATAQIHTGLFYSGVLGCIRDNLTSRENASTLSTGRWEAISRAARGCFRREDWT
jgi:hypothetical protein